MRRLVLGIVALLASCDLVERDPNDPLDCCYLMPRTDAVLACNKAFLEPGECVDVSCLGGAWTGRICAEDEPQ